MSNKNNRKIRNIKSIVALLVVVTIIVSSSVVINKDLLFGRDDNILFINTKSWMASISDDTELSSINIPGTHDSAAVNPHFKDIYARHYATITQQLNSGIRLLDVRLQLAQDENGNYTFLTCHGNIGSTLSLNTYQCFESLLSECDSFLLENPSETIIMTLKIDDNTLKNDEDYSEALMEVENLLSTHLVRPYQPNLGSIGESRGKIVLFNRINNNCNLGYPMHWDDNPTDVVLVKNSQNYNDRNFNIYVQDHYNLGFNAFSANSKKANDVLNAARKIYTGNGDVLFNFSSACVFFAVPINPNFKVIEYNDNANLGWVLTDYEQQVYDTQKYGKCSYIKYIIASNFEYENILDEK